MDNLMEIVIQNERAEISSAILSKYNQPGPRYTSYPTVPEWNAGFGVKDAVEAYERANDRSAPLSFYFHIPFCESLCLYCGCNVVINKKHEAALPYLEHMKREIDWICGQINPDRKIEQLHWGGGTPTYLSADQIEDLYSYIKDRFSFGSEAEIGIELDPRATTEEQCRVLKRLGFNRLSMGVQDFNPLVQKTVNRIQPYEMTKALYDCCRELGFESINIDLIYGLPHQTVESFSETVEKVIGMNPDRIAVYSYAHVPWIKKQQNSFARFLPAENEKFSIFNMAIGKLTDAGYRYIGMDHFARPDDELCRSQDQRTLHRNFQGYTTKAGCDLYGVGVSSISGLEDAYIQNWSSLSQYYEAIDKGCLPIMRGIQLTDEDKLRRSVIGNILCSCVVVKSEIESRYGIDFNEHFSKELERLRELEQDKLVRIREDRIEATALGRIFIRNVAMVFDSFLDAAKDQKQRIFSKTL